MSVPKILTSLYNVCVDTFNSGYNSSTKIVNFLSDKISNVAKSIFASKTATGITILTSFGAYILYNRAKPSPINTNTTTTTTTPTTTTTTTTVPTPKKSDVNLDGTEEL